VVPVLCVLCVWPVFCFKIWHLRAGYPASNLKRFFEAGCHQDYSVLHRHRHLDYNRYTVSKIEVLPAQYLLLVVSTPSAKRYFPEIPQPVHRRSLFDLIPRATRATCTSPSSTLQKACPFRMFSPLCRDSSWDQLSMNLRVSVSSCEVSLRGCNMYI